MPDTIPFGSAPIQTSKQTGTIPFGSNPIGPVQGPNTLQKVGDFAGKMLNTVEEPFINVAATGVQALAQGAYNLAGGKGDFNIFPNGVNPNRSLTEQSIPISSVTTPQGWLQKAGSAGQIATTALSPAAGSIKSMAALGVASGLSQSLQSGETDIPQIGKDTLYGGLLGAATGVLSSWMKGIGNMEQAKTGVVGQAQKEIAETDPNLLKSYIDTTKAHSTDIRALTPDSLAETEFRNRAQTLVTKAIPDAGKAVGAARSTASKVPVAFTNETGQVVRGSEAVNNVSDQINEVMQNMTGHQFSSYEQGGTAGLKINYPGGATTAGIEPIEGAITKLPGRAVELSTSEIKQLENVDKYLKTLQQNPTVQTASDMLINIDNDIGKWSTPIYGEQGGNTPVEGVLRYARGAINRIISPASPEIAAANAKYSSLMDLKAAIGAEAGNRGQNASLAMRRVLSGDQAGDIIPMLDQLDAAIKTYRPPGDNSSLVQHAIVSSWAKNTFGDSSTKTLLKQYVSAGSDSPNNIFGQTTKWIQGGANKLLSTFSPDPEAFAMSVARGEPQSMNILARGIDNLVESSKSVPILKQFIASAKSLGITSDKVEGVAKTMFKIWLIQQLTSPKQSQPEQSGPDVFLPASVNRTLTQ